VLRQLTPAERARLSREVEPLVDFVPRISPHLLAPTHLAPVAEVLDRALHEKVDVCISVPPGTGKTEIVLHHVAQRLALRPRHTVGYATYAADLSLSKSRLCRDYARRAGVAIRDDSDAVHEWRTTAGGGFLATSIDGPFTGQHVDELVIDDPFKNRAAAESPAERDRVHGFFTSVANARCKPHASRVVVHTRWHDDDLIGRLAKQLRPKWLVINIPALTDAAGRPDVEGGHVMFPQRMLATGELFGWTLDDLLDRLAENEYDFHSLYQGDPRPRGGAVFRAEPARYVEAALEGARIVLACDAAGTEKTAADFTAAVALAVTGDGARMRADVLEAWEAQLTPEHAAPELLAFVQRNHDGELFIEATRDGKALAKTLKMIEPRLRFRFVLPIGDKFTRAQPGASGWNQGRVRVPLQAPWLATFLHRMSKFTGIGSKKKDMVDAYAHAWNVALGVARLLAEDPPPPPSDPGRFADYGGRGFGG
jgi:predicted phage terminase large subunit-like protein